MEGNWYLFSFAYIAGSIKRNESVSLGGHLGRACGISMVQINQGKLILCNDVFGLRNCPAILFVSMKKVCSKPQVLMTIFHARYHIFTYRKCKCTFTMHCTKFDDCMHKATIPFGT